MRPRKRILVTLLGLSLFFLIGVSLALRYLFARRWPWGPQFLHWFWVFFLGGTGLLAFGILALVILLLWQRSLTVLRLPAGWAVELLFPLAQRLSRLFGVSRTALAGSYIEVNNQLVAAEERKFRPEEILLLAPHCLQRSTCPYKVTHRVDNCRRCGGCQISALLELRDRFGVKLAVATGGTLARRLVQELRPRAILAVACERDLLSGIFDCHPLPVIGVINERPHGPCRDTCLDLARVEAALQQLVGGTHKGAQKENFG